MGEGARDDRHSADSPAYLDPLTGLVQAAASLMADCMRTSRAELVALRTIMTALPLTVTTDASVEELAGLMRKFRSVSGPRRWLRNSTRRERTIERRR